MKTDKPMLTRRSTLAALARMGVAAYFVPAWNETVEAADTITCVASTPTITEGPYWVDEKLCYPYTRNVFGDVHLHSSPESISRGITTTLFRMI